MTRMGFLGISETFQLGLIIPEAQNAMGVVGDPGIEFQPLLIPLHQLHAPISGKNISAWAVREAIMGIFSVLGS